MKKAINKWRQKNKGTKFVLLLLFVVLEVTNKSRLEGLNSLIKTYIYRIRSVLLFSVAYYVLTSVSLVLIAFSFLVPRVDHIEISLLYCLIRKDKREERLGDLKEEDLALQENGKSILLRRLVGFLSLFHVAIVDVKERLSLWFDSAFSVSK